MEMLADVNADSCEFETKCRVRILVCTFKLFMSKPLNPLALYVIDLLELIFSPLMLAGSSHSPSSNRAGHVCGELVC